MVNCKFLKNGFIPNDDKIHIFNIYQRGISSNFIHPEIVVFKLFDKQFYYF